MNLLVTCEIQRNHNAWQFDWREVAKLLGSIPRNLFLCQSDWGMIWSPMSNHCKIYKYILKSGIACCVLMLWSIRIRDFYKISPSQMLLVWLATQFKLFIFRIQTWSRKRRAFYDCVNSYWLVASLLCLFGYLIKYLKYWFPSSHSYAKVNQQVNGPDILYEVGMHSSTACKFQKSYLKWIEIHKEFSTQVARWLHFMDKKVIKGSKQNCSS